ncbi:MAG: hypothetical protein VB025_09210 [Sphaerochaeta sp.]|nr:hypothetical protein [Sphaerochaeta sp.]
MPRNKGLKLLREHSVAETMKRLDDTRLADQEGSVSAWTAPVWNIGKLNLNGRLYGEELAKRIVAAGKATISYDSHRHDYGDAYGDVVAVAKNPRIEGDQLWVDIFMVDAAYSAKVDAINKAGVGIGVSCVGYGETDKDGVVNPATYELVRYLDFVVDPANETYAAPAGGSKKNESVEDDQESGEPLPEETEEPSEEITERIELYKRLEALENKEN